MLRYTSKGPRLRVPALSISIKTSNNIYITRLLEFLHFQGHPFKDPHSLSDALGRISVVLPSQRDYSIILLEGTKVTQHPSDIVSALATKTNSDVTLIDPFQLID